MLRSPLQQRALQLTRGMRPASSVLTALRFGCKMENGQRIYTSDSPSILHDLQKENHVLDFLMKRIDRFDPSRVSVIQGDTGESLTLGQLKELVESVAGLYYHACGLRQGDVVCLSLPNHYYYPALAYGAMRCGAAVSTVNPLNDVDTLAYYLECTKAKVLVGCHLFRPVLEATVSRLHRDGKEVKLLFLEDIVREGSFTPVPADYRPIEKATLDDTVYIPFSSGTTGLPKGVQLTNRNLIAASLQCFEHFQFTSEMTSLSILPYFHAYGFNGNMTTILATGSRQVVLSKYSLDTMLDYIQRYKVTFSCIAPPILLSLLRNAEKVRQYDISSLASLHCGAAALSHTTQKGV
ncbi:AMP-binding enzyme, putative [Angomonas deanei]|uniref:AMP-binding enzyme, putative n=1 Tax=Angomonas deanei TaxID=59799 RepID=A0A7G2CCN2_9TRYP|nr:AMP-binding enzyme, putative [Angomonas deanei]